ncbi:MAG: hypothetical protein R3F37_03025 [Candidatus Competibacteraceae bacterium]
MTNATLHNADEVHRKDVRAEIRSSSAGLEMLFRKSSGYCRNAMQGAAAFALPERCPVCGSQVIRPEDGGGAMRRRSVLQCPTQGGDSSFRFPPRPGY